VPGNASPNRAQQTSERPRQRLSARLPSLRTALIVSIGLLIVFRWLHLILALEIVSTGREMQIQTEELQRIERQNAALQREIAGAESPKNLAERAYQQGYRPRQPIYLRSSRPMPPADADAQNPAAVNSEEGRLASNMLWLAPWNTLTWEPTIRSPAESVP
jgi:hypothetical protein